jgi:hypothetical protein
VGNLIYSAIASLDGYIEDAEGRFDWAAPSEEVHAFVNELERPIGTYLYGRRMYETMVFWENPPELAEAADGRAGLRADLASGGQDRLQQDVGDGDERKNVDRARIRRRCGSRVEGDDNR